MEVSAYSSRGGRKYNEDTYDIVQKDTQSCFILADGLGGHGGGDIASQTAAAEIKKCFSSTDKEITREILDKWFGQVNQCIVAKQTSACRMKTTLVTLCINEIEKKAVWAHLGDSRLYHFENGKEVFCTFDHSVSRMAVLRGEIGVTEVRFHPDRSKLLKVVGKEDMSRPEYGECVLDDTKQHAFLLCTDGFWEYVTEEKMEEALQCAKTPEQWLSFMRQELEKKVDGKNDNHTAVAIFI